MKLFISYAREDEAFRKELAKHLSPLLRQKVISDWHDRKLVPGQDWGREISTHLQSAAVILLLVSPDFVASDYCWDKEMVHALAMEARGDAVVIPVMIRPVDVEGAPFAHLQALPTDARPVSTWGDHDQAWVDVVRGIRRVLDSFRPPVSPAPTPPPVPPGAPAPGETTKPAPTLRQSRGHVGAWSYGDVAVLAVRHYVSGGYPSPRAAWSDAAHQLLPTTSLRVKNCPRATFLSLCQDGWIAGIPAGEYVKARENRVYARVAVRRLADEPALANGTPEDLWRLVMGEADTVHNHQMEVVQALWRNGLIKAGDPPDGDAVEPRQGRAMLHWLGTEGERLVDAFQRVFGVPGHPFGNRARQIGGLSDGNEGVQWNAGYDPRDGSCWVGVNLEGMQYRDWPVARLIQRELAAPTLPARVRELAGMDRVQIHWRRDYWQAASRPEIQERSIAPTPLLAGQLTEDLWRQALQEAAGCLASSAGGRALQEVTLAKSGKRVPGTVSPHLTLRLPSSSPDSWLSFLSEGRQLLKPLYEWAVERSG